MGIELSILVPSIHKRFNNFALRIQDQLYKQRDRLTPADQERVEILVLTDTMTRTIGAKRNALVGIARGRYVQFVDDDDRLHPTALKQVLDATGSDADAIVFLALVSINGGPQRVCRYSRRYGRDINTETEYHRLPNHICAVKRDLVIATGFPDKSYGEDADYARRLLPRLRTEYRIDQALYFYDYDRKTSASRG